MQHGEEGTTTTLPHAQSFIIKRPRLTKLLDESEARIILLVAPAGYGKTTLAREWLAADRGPVAWYAASAASADVVALATGIASELDAAIGDGSRTCVERLSDLAAVQQRPDALARTLVNSRPAWPRHLRVAIDDYHHLIGSPAAEDFVGTLVLLLPAAFVIATRTRPAWSAARLAVYGDAVEVGTSDLQMTDEEARGVLERSPGRGSTPSIQRLARGWPVVIGLAARTRRRNFPETLPSRLYEFLADDLIEAAPADTKETLTVLALTGISDLSTLYELVGPAAESGVDDAARRALVTFEGTGRVALHPLLAEFLIARLRRQPDQLAIARPLMDKLKDSGRWDECLALAESVPRLPVPLPEILERALNGFLEGGRLGTVRRWVDLARRTGVDAPIVDLADGEICLRAGDYERALALGSRAADRLSAPELRSGAQLLAARAAHLADQRSAAGNWFRRAEASATSSHIRAASVWGQFLVAWEEESTDLERALQRVEEATDGSPTHELRLIEGRMLFALAHRSVNAALDASRAGQSLLSLPAEPLTRLAVLNLHAWLVASNARYAEAFAASDRVLAEAEEAGAEFVVDHALIAQLTALTGLRRFAAARQTIDRLARRLRDEPDQWLGANVAMGRARLQVSLGDLDRAADELLSDLDGRQAASLCAEYYATRALVDAARGATADAEKWLTSCAERSNYLEAYAISAVTRAILAANTGDPSAAVEAFRLALATGHRDSIVIGCRAQPELATVVATHGDDQDSLRKIFIDSADAALARAAGIRIPRTSVRPTTLSQRELEVYELLAQGRTNRQIAQTLFISQSTTKVHVRHIFEKLGVRSRVEAVRAWEPAADQETAADDAKMARSDSA